MVKCNECGFLSVWLVREQIFVEATEYFRENGRPENMVMNPMAYQAKCFIQAIPINTEVSPDDRHESLKYKDAVASVIKKNRICNRKILWSQGLHPKERVEMQLNQEAVNRERSHANRSLMVAIVASMATIMGTVIGAIINSNSAQIGAEATIKAAQMQIEAQRDISKQSQPINVTVNVQDPKQPKADQSIPPKTTHDDPKPRQP